jgi:UDP-N-acetylglucosamine transferase subunit ALG13
VIVVTVGTQLPFDRLVAAIDALAPSLPMPVFAQIGAGSSYQPRNMRFAATLRAGEFDEILGSAKLIVSHAGIGTVLMAQKLAKPIVLFPRRAAHREHRNDHQLATIGQLRNRPGVTVAFEEAELADAIGKALAAPPPPPGIESAARSQLKDAIGSYLRFGRMSPPGALTP